MTPDRTFIRLHVHDEGKKKGFKLYFNEVMSCRKQKSGDSQPSKKLEAFFKSNKLIRNLDNFDAKTLWNQIIWDGTC